jgi:hypothetical protein
MSYGYSPSSGNMDSFEKRAIYSLKPILESLQNQVAQRSAKAMPEHLDFLDEKKENSRKIYRMEPKGISVIFWDTTVPSDRCMHVERGIGVKDFLDTYVKKIEDAGKIARTLNVSLMQ